MDRTYLQLTSLTGDGKRKAFNVPDPRADLTMVEVQTAMDAVITADVFVVGLTAKHSAVIITTTRTDIFS